MMDIYTWLSEHSPRRWLWRRILRRVRDLALDMLFGSADDFDGAEELTSYDELDGAEAEEMSREVSREEVRALARAGWNFMQDKEMKDNGDAELRCKARV